MEVQRYVKARVLECEECVFTASGQADAPEEPEAAETGNRSLFAAIKLSAWVCAHWDWTQKVRLDRNVKIKILQYKHKEMKIQISR